MAIKALTHLIERLGFTGWVEIFALKVANWIPLLDAGRIWMKVDF